MDFQPRYLGCRDAPGHFVWLPNGSRAQRGDCDWLWQTDSLFPPQGGAQGEASLCHLNGCTVLAFWDRSVDSRPGSHSTFALPGMLGFDAAVECAMTTFPWVWARFKFSVHPMKGL